LGRHGGNLLANQRPQIHLRRQVIPNLRELNAEASKGDDLIEAASVFACIKPVSTCSTRGAQQSHLVVVVQCANSKADHVG
jgi:hypothetical protein